MNRPLRTRIKICGITRPGDGAAAIAAGADALGMIFWPPSSRNVALEAAAQICALPGPFCERVAVFVDPEPVFVQEVVARAGPTCLQFHGAESAEFCRSFGLPYLKALRMRGGVDLRVAAREYGDARGLLLDSYVPGRPGGTGETFAWERARMQGGGARPIVLAGGLTAQNVADAIAAAEPYGVDVSGSVEEAPGVKDIRLVAKFCRAVRDADRENRS